MVAVIKTGTSISRILRYNEDKLKSGAARFLGEKNCPFQGDAVGLMPKLNYLERIAALNSRVTRKSVHISLNFSRQEESLPDKQLMEVATAYMEGIGFDKQPWLAYRHLDAGHPHLHLVSLKVRPDGSRIDMQNIGRNQSEATRKNIEKKYGLVTADNLGRLPEYRPDPLSVGRLHYGKAPTKKAMGTILQFVLQKYRFSSLAELNAVLGRYNLRADRGKVTSRTFLSGGLRYSALNANGTPEGVPIKASAFHFSPTLKNLELLFARNTTGQAKAKVHIKTVVDSCLLKNPPQNLNGLQQALRPSGIDLVLREAENGQVYGVTFIDHASFWVLNGSTLGKAYSAKGLQERLQTGLQDTFPGQKPSPVNNTVHQAPGHNSDTHGEGIDMMHKLLRPEAAQEYNAQGFSGHKKQKKKRRNR